MRIFLVGFMGSGKSYTGKRLAKLLNFDFIDLDNYIETKTQSTITEIFTIYGEDKFRKIEQNTLHSIVKEQEAAIIVSCGGGTPCFFDNMQWMNQHGITIYLDTPVSVLMQRLKPGIINRPLLRNKSDVALEAFIATKLESRDTFYNCSMITIHQYEFHFDAAGIISRHFLDIVGH